MTGIITVLFLQKKTIRKLKAFLKQLNTPFESYKKILEFLVPVISTKKASFGL